MKSWVMPLLAKSKLNDGFVVPPPAAGAGEVPFEQPEATASAPTTSREPPVAISDLQRMHTSVGAAGHRAVPKIVVAQPGARQGRTVSRLVPRRRRRGG